MSALGKPKGSIPLVSLENYDDYEDKYYLNRYEFFGNYAETN